MADTPNKGGRPPFRPTPSKRALVIKRVASGMSRHLISEELKISQDTLELYFGEELRDGKHLFRKVLIDRLDKAASKGNVAAVKALVALTHAPIQPQEDGASPEAAAQGQKLGKKEAAKARAQSSNAGKFATPEPPPGMTKTTVQ